MKVNLNLPQKRIISGLYNELNGQELAFLDKMKVKNRMQLGNKKISQKVGIFNLRAVHDCGNCSTCSSSCYAVQRQLMYPNVRRSRRRNSFLAQRFPNLLKYLIVKQIYIQKIPIIRAHESGDYINPDYISMWEDIAKACPDTKFYSYTKMFSKYNTDLNRLNERYNYNVINSMLLNKIRNYGNIEYIRFLVYNFGAFPCPDTIPEEHKHIFKDIWGNIEHEQHNTCMNTCSYCLTGDKPCFGIHGTKFKRDNYNTDNIIKVYRPDKVFYNNIIAV